jgi:hypothetical protein
MNMVLITGFTLQQLNLTPVFCFMVGPYLETRSDYIASNNIQDAKGNWWNYYFYQPFVSEEEAYMHQQNHQNYLDARLVVQGHVAVDATKTYVCIYFVFLILSLLFLRSTTACVIIMLSCAMQVKCRRWITTNSGDD